MAVKQGTYNVETGIALVTNLVDVFAGLADDDAGVAGNDQGSHRDLGGLGLGRVAYAASTPGSLVAIVAVGDRAVVGLVVATRGGICGDAGAEVDGILLLGLCGSVGSHSFGGVGIGGGRGVFVSGGGGGGVFGLDLVVGLYVGALSLGFRSAGRVSLTLCDF